MKLVRITYSTTSKDQWKKDFGLINQIRRSAVSVSANIVEGYEKNNNNELIRYLRIAKGSLGETRNHYYIAKTIGYLKQEEFSEINKEILKLSNEIGGFIIYLDNYRKKSVIRNP